MKSMKKMKGLLLCMVMVLSLLAVPINANAAAKIKLSAKSATLTVGKTKTLTLKKGSKKVKGVKWKTSNKKVATVSSSGKIKAKKAGKANITATYKKKKYVCKVTVKAKKTTSNNNNNSNSNSNNNSNTNNDNNNTNTNNDSNNSNTTTKEPVYAISQTSAGVEVEKTLRLTVTKDSSAISAGISWSSSNTSVATVSSGTITAVGPGTATITATVDGKSLTCALTVTVPDYAMSDDTLKLDTLTNPQSMLFVMNGTSYVEDAAWTSSNENVVTVEDGAVTAVGDGAATITAKKYGKECKCEVTVDGFVFSRDVEITDDSKDVYIEFTFNKEEVTAEELKAAGYTVNGDTASKNTTCETRTYTFVNNRLPVTLDEFKQIPLDSKFGAMAATICAMATADVNNYNKQNIDKCPTCDILDYLNGPKCDFNNFAKDHLASQSFYALRANGAQNSFFEGATTKNGYTPTKPLSFTLYVGPYYIPASSNSVAYGSTPERYMVLLSFGGDDSERYIDVYQSSDGNWYSWMDQWKHMAATFKPVDTQW